MSDFHATIGVIHEGRCPLCGGATHENELAFEDGPGLRCEPCDISWRIGKVHDPVPREAAVIGMGPMIFMSRRLTSDEIKRLYNRGEN